MAGTTGAACPFPLSEKATTVFSKNEFYDNVTLAKERQAKGHSVLRLDIGDYCDPPLPSIVKAAERIVAKGHSNYGAGQGAIELREAVAKFLHNATGVQSNPLTEILITPGASPALAMAFQTLLNPGDEILTPTPFYPKYPAGIALAGAKPVYYEQFADIEKLVTSKTKAILVCNPNNPTGYCATLAELSKLAEFAFQKKLPIIYDAAYECVYFDEATPPPSILKVAAHCLPNIIYIFAIGKPTRTTGYRVAAVKAHATLIQSMTAHQGVLLSCPNTPLQLALAEGFAAASEWKDHRVQLKEKRDKLAEQLRKFDPLLTFTLPQATFYFWVNVAQLMKDTGVPDTKTLFRALLEEAGALPFPRFLPFFFLLPPLSSSFLFLPSMFTSSLSRAL